MIEYILSFWISQFLVGLTGIYYVAVRRIIGLLVLSENAWQNYVIIINIIIIIIVIIIIIIIIIIITIINVIIITTLFSVGFQRNVIVCKANERHTAWKVSKCGVISGPYFRLFRLNAGKYGPEITHYLDTFHAVQLPINSESQNKFQNKSCIVLTDNM